MRLRGCVAKKAQAVGEKLGEGKVGERIGVSPMRTLACQSLMLLPPPLPTTLGPVIPASCPPSPLMRSQLPLLRCTLPQAMTEHGAQRDASLPL